MDGVGDLFIVIIVELHDVFKRDIMIFTTEIQSSFTESALGQQ